MRALLGVLCLRTVATIFELIGFIFFFFFFFFFFFYIYIFFLPLTLNTVFNYRESIDSD